MPIATSLTATSLPAAPMALGPSWLEPESLISTFGFLGILAIIFAECGLLIGFFLPGDSLLFTAGLLIGDGEYLRQPLWLACLLLWAAALAGNQVGYAIGRRAGPAVFSRPHSRLFKREYVDRTGEFFDRYGGRAIVLARFVPVVRTFITVMAGTCRMDYRRYTAYSALGAALWAGGVTVLGYRLGSIGFVREHIEPILLGVVALSVVPIAIHLLRERRRAHRSRTTDAILNER